MKAKVHRRVKKYHSIQHSQLTAGLIIWCASRMRCSQYLDMVRRCMNEFKAAGLTVCESCRAHLLGSSTSAGCSHGVRSNQNIKSSNAPLPLFQSSPEPPPARSLPRRLPPPPTHPRGTPSPARKAARRPHRARGCRGPRRRASRLHCAGRRTNAQNPARRRRASSSRAGCRGGSSTQRDWMVRWLYSALYICGSHQHRGMNV